MNNTQFIFHFFDNENKKNMTIDYAVNCDGVQHTTINGKKQWMHDNIELQTAIKDKIMAHVSQQIPNFNQYNFHMEECCLKKVFVASDTNNEKEHKQEGQKQINKNTPLTLIQFVESTICDYMLGQPPKNWVEIYHYQPTHHHYMVHRDADTVNLRFLKHDHNVDYVIIPQCEDKTVQKGGKNEDYYKMKYMQSKARYLDFKEQQNKRNFY